MADVPNHSPLGGSSAHRFLACAGYFLLFDELTERGEIEEIESPYAALGVAAHDAAATCLQKNIEPFELVGQSFGGHVVGKAIDPDALSVWFAECSGILRKAVEVREYRVMIESFINLPHLHPLLRGTVDFAFWSPQDGLHVRDYKNGSGIAVPARDNEQLLYYAFLIIMDDSELQELPSHAPVSLGIVQPHVHGIFSPPDVWDTTIGHVLEWGNNVLLPRMHMLTEKRGISDNDFVAGDHCQFCPVLLECPLMQQLYREYENASEEMIEMLTDEELGLFYAKREHVRRFMNALERSIHARLMGGKTIPSAKLVRKRSTREWKDGAEEAIVSVFGDAAYRKELKSPSQIERLSSRGKELAIEYGYMPESDDLVVAPLDDPRPAIIPQTNAEVFAEFADPDLSSGF